MIKVYIYLMRWRHPAAIFEVKPWRNNRNAHRLANEQPPFDLKARAPYWNDVMCIRSIFHGANWNWWLLYLPTSLCSNTPIFRHPYVPTPLCTDNSTYIPTPLCSDTPMFRHPYVPTPLCSDTLILHSVHSWDIWIGIINATTHSACWRYMTRPSFIVSCLC